MFSSLIYFFSSSVPLTFPFLYPILLFLSVPDLPILLSLTIPYYIYIPFTFISSSFLHLPYYLMPSYPSSFAATHPIIFLPLPLPSPPIPTPSHLGSDSGPGRQLIKEALHDSFHCVNEAKKLRGSKQLLSSCLC